MTSPSQPAPRPTIAALPAYVAGKRSRSTGIEPLASNESHFAPLRAVQVAISLAATRVNRYPDMASMTLRERVAGELDVTTDEVTVGPGSVGVLAQIISALCDPGDEVVFAWRSFEAYPILCQIAGAVPVRVPLDVDERHDLEAMASAITERTKVVLLCSPNNPTGTAISETELRKFCANVPSEVLVVIDEAYREFAPDAAPDTMSLYRAYPNVCLLRTFSKAYGLAGLRVGYAVARPEIADGLRRTQIPFSVSAVAEAAAVAALDSADEVAARCAEVVAERTRVIAATRELGWLIPDGSANFIWLRLDDDRRARLIAAFDDAKILVRGYAGDGVRITIGSREANDRVLAVLATHVGLAR